MKTILQNNFISRDIKDQVFYLPKEELNFQTGINKLIARFDGSANLKYGFAIIDVSDYVIEKPTFFLDFFAALGIEAERRIIVVTPDKRITDEELFIYFDSRKTLDSFDSQNAFRADSYRLNGLLRILMPNHSHMPPPEIFKQ